MRGSKPKLTSCSGAMEGGWLVYRSISAASLLFPVVLVMLESIRDRGRLNQAKRRLDV